MVNVIQARTLKQIRQAVGYNIRGKNPSGRAVWVGSTTSAGGDTSSVVDTKLVGGDDEYNGHYVKFVSGTLDGEQSRASDYSASAYDITVAPVFTVTVPTGASYEMWDDPYDPTFINELINQQILDATGRVYDAEVDVSLHLHPDVWSYSIPSQFAMINKLEQRVVLSDIEVHSCDRLFDETTDANFTQSLDTEDKRRGNSSLKVVVAAGASAGDLITDAIASTNLSKYTYLEFWANCTVAATAGQLSIKLDDTAACVSPLETLAVPALTANVWTFCRVALANPETDTALISVGLDYTADLGACTIWLDDIRAVQDTRVIWDEIPRHQWHIDQEGRLLVFKLQPRYRLLKVHGGDKPALLTADSSVSEIDDWYIICGATAAILQATSDGSVASRSEIANWLARAQMSKGGWPMLKNVRKVATA